MLRGKKPMLLCLRFWISIIIQSSLTIHSRRLHLWVKDSQLCAVAWTVGVVHSYCSLSLTTASCFSSACHRIPWHHTLLWFLSTLRSCYRIDDLWDNHWGVLQWLFMEICFLSHSLIVFFPQIHIQNARDFNTFNNMFISSCEKYLMLSLKMPSGSILSQVFPLRNGWCLVTVL